MESSATHTGRRTPPDATDPVAIWRLPGTRIGWWAFALTVLIFPVAWALMTHAIPWEALDTALAPVILLTIIDAAAVVGLYAVFRARERSFLVLFALVAAIPLAVFATFMLVVEVLFPH